MRLIDADELLRRYDEEHEGSPGKARKLIEKAPTISGLIRVNECSSCRYWDSKSGLSARMCKQFNGFTTQHEFCSKWIPKEEDANGNH